MYIKTGVNLLDNNINYKKNEGQYQDNANAIYNEFSSFQMKFKISCL